MQGAWRLREAWSRLRQRGIILMYHRVAELEYDPWKLSVTPKHFEEQLQVLRNCGHCVTAQQFGGTLRRFSWGRNEMVVTFDDGYSDNFHNASRLLQKYDIPATFFIVSEAIDKREEFWWDELERIILAAPVLPAEFKMTIAAESCHWLLHTTEKQSEADYGSHGREVLPQATSVSRRQLYVALWNILSRLPREERGEVLRRIALWAEYPSEARPGYFPMTLNNLRSIADCKLFEIGAHTKTHPMLASLPEDQQEEEIFGSKQLLEAMVGKSVTSFSYPHGSYSHETMRILQSAGFDVACTVVAKNVLWGADPLQLPRLGVLDWNGDEFESKLKEWAGLF